jgi:hypothetical protein
MAAIQIPRTFDSFIDPDLNQFTRLTLNQTTGFIESFTVIRNNLEIYSLRPVEMSPAYVRFIKYDLENLAHNVDGNDPNFLGLVHYQPGPDSRPAVELLNETTLVLGYNVPALIIKPQGGPMEPPAFDAIKFLLTYTKAADAKGWIDLDAEFFYPAQIQTPSYPFGWQSRLFYPNFQFENTVINDPLNQYLILDPAGKVENFHDAALKFVTSIYNPPMPLPFTAIYKLGTVENLQAASGLAISAFDEQGHHKSLLYRPDQTKTRTSLTLSTIPPINLNAQKQYLRPISYKLSGGRNDHLFSGGAMSFRLRAFQVDGRLPGVPVDWYDVANLYRKWVRTRTNTLFRKAVPHSANGLVDNRNPYTFVVNYSIDGQVDPLVKSQNDENIRSWLEVHPMTEQSDMPDNSNVSVPALLGRMQDRLGVWTDWEDLGARLDGAVMTTPAVSFRPPNRVDVFAIGADKNVHYTGWNGLTWTAWQKLSSTGNFNTPPASVSWDANRIDVFATGTDNFLYHAFWTPSGWNYMAKGGGNVSSAPSVISTAPNRLDVFYLDSSGKVTQNSFDGANWDTRHTIDDTPVASPPAACFQKPDRIHVFARGRNANTLLVKTRMGNSWSGWKDLKVTLQETPAAASWGFNRVDVFAKGTDNGLKQLTGNGSTWASQWKPLDPISFPAAVVATAQNRLELFTRSAANTLLRRTFDTRLEAQIWGFEICGFYRYLAGLPPATNIIKGDLNRFRTALKALVDQGVTPSATTDPMNPVFNRKRFRGHLLRINNLWVEAIADSFPNAIQTYLTTQGRGSTVDGSNNRSLTINLSHPDYIEFSKNLRLGYSGEIRYSYGPLAQPFYGADIHKMCPTPEVESAYLNKWVQRGLLDENFRLIEYMKHNNSENFCYDKTHRHIPESDPTWPYATAIGYGPWHTNRLISLFKGLQQRGYAIDPSFSLTQEFIPLDVLVPYINEFYDSSSSTSTMFEYTLPPLAANVLVADSTSLSLRSAPARQVERRVPIFFYVYSPLITQKMHFGELHPLIHPGYVESPNPTTGASEPDNMLSPVRDDDSSQTTFAQWKGICESYWNSNFFVNTVGKNNYGIAPRNYATKSNSTYTYNRGVTATFNLRCSIFRYGAAAVLGERILLNSLAFEEPDEYYRAVTRMGILGALMQMEFKEFFRSGYMLGQTQIKQGNKPLWAWRVRNRNFADVEELVKKLNGPTMPTTKVSIYEAASHGTDVEKITPWSSYAYPPAEEHEKYNAFRITTDKIQHMVWRLDVSPTKYELLYLFANVGNRANGGTGNDPQLEFLYSRGLETGTNWKRIIYTFDDTRKGLPSQPASIQYNTTEKINMAPRSLIAIRIFN